MDTRLCIKVKAVTETEQLPRSIKVKDAHIRRLIEDFKDLKVLLTTWHFL